MTLMQKLEEEMVVQELLGHEDLNTTAIYTHGDVALGVSPLDAFSRPTPSPLLIGGFS